MTGSQLSVAVALLQQDGFSVGITRVNREAPVDEVLEQDPPAGETSLDCSFLSFFCSKPEVALTVSQGPGTGKVPSTNGLDAEEATEKLEAAGFEVATEESNSESVEEGAVIYSEPKGGSLATRGSTVTIFVSKGPKQAKVPVLVGAQRRLAVQQIRGRGLVPSVSEEESSSPAGQVISQSPSAGSEVPLGLDRLDRRRQGRRRSEGAERDRQAPLRSGAGDPRTPAWSRAWKKKKPKCPARSAAPPTSSRRQARNSSPAPK